MGVWSCNISTDPWDLSLNVSMQQQCPLMWHFEYFLVFLYICQIYFFASVNCIYLCFSKLLFYNLIGIFFRSVVVTLVQSTSECLSAAAAASPLQHINVAPRFSMILWICKPYFFVSLNVFFCFYIFLSFF